MDGRLLIFIIAILLVFYFTGRDFQVGVFDVVMILFVAGVGFGFWYLTKGFGGGE